MNPELLTLADAAKEVGVTAGRLRQLVASNDLRATMYGHSYVVTRTDLDAFRKVERKLGRPPKHAEPARPRKRTKRAA